MQKIHTVSSQNKYKRFHNIVQNHRPLNSNKRCNTTSIN